MVILNILFILIPAILATEYFLRDERLLGRLGAIAFFSLILVPFVNINCVLLNGNYISDKLIFVNSLFLIILFIILIFYSRKANTSKKIISHGISKDESWVLIIIGLIAVFAFHYFSNKEFLLSLGSYLIKGDVECFFMETFRTVKLLNPDGIPTNKIYEINCTPGNILFTSTLVSFLKLHSFKIIYMLFMCLLFIFVYLIVNKLLGHRIVSLMTAIFAVLNPYILSVEVLDRNVMALTISTILFYLLLEHKNKIFLHGLVFGILSGTGLRFLPLLFIVPIAMLYYRERLNVKAYLIFISAFIITFTFNIPHLYFHGFHSLGETRPSWYLLLEVFMKWMRTPFLPFPNIIFYSINIVNYFGYLVSGIILFGAFNLWKINKKYFLIFSYLFVSALFILSYQRNWIQGAKYRIIIESLLALYIFFAYGLRNIFTKTVLIKKYVLILICFLVPIIFVQVISAAYFGQDIEFFRRKYLYQKESKDYYELEKKFLQNISLLPNYKRLFAKLDIRKKRIEEEIMFKKIFPKEELPNFDKFKNFYLDWKEYFLKNNKDSFREPLPASYVYVQIDFENLTKNLVDSVKMVEYADICAIDLMKEENLFDVYYADLNVGWQKELLPVCVILNNEEIKYLKELNIDLNAFVSLGKDEAGFDIVNSINFKANPILEKIGFQSGMGSFPLYAEENVMVFRLPKDLKIVIRNWFINERGIPYKVDSWCIRPDKNGDYRAEFFYNEPESYL